MFRAMPSDSDRFLGEPHTSRPRAGRVIAGAGALILGFLCAGGIADDTGFHDYAFRVNTATAGPLDPTRIYDPNYHKYKYFRKKKPETT